MPSSDPSTDRPPYRSPPPQAGRSPRRWRPPPPSVLSTVTLTLALGACQPGADPAAGTGAQQTAFPGQVTAGGNTSGAVMNRTQDMAGAARQSGTPGIPQGAGGNTGGAARGGTTEDSALRNSGEQAPAQRGANPGAPAHQGAGATAAAPAASAAPPADAASQEAARQKQALDVAMARVSERWRARAAVQGWLMHPPTAVDAQAGFADSQHQSGPSGQPGGRLGSVAQQAPLRSEKSGTAAPSADVKQPQPASGVVR
jgi:hypothetical protein